MARVAYEPAVQRRASQVPPMHSPVALHGSPGFFCAAQRPVGSQNEPLGHASESGSQADPIASAVHTPARQVLPSVHWSPAQGAGGALRAAHFRVAGSH